MATDILVESGPDDVLERLRRRAARSNRALQDELTMILTAAANEAGALSPAELLQWGRASGLETPAEAADTISAHRDGP